MKKLLSIFIILILSLGTVFGYNITQRDEQIIDQIEEKLVEKIEQNSQLTPELVVLYIDRKLQQKKYSARVVVILEAIQDDIKYMYYLGEYKIQESQVYEPEAYTHSHGSDYEDEEILASYTILGDNISLISGQDSLRHQKIWDIFTTLIPLSQRQYFLYFNITDEKDSDTGAHVEQDSIDNTKWSLSINLDSFYVNNRLDTEYVYSTLIHEFSHVLTLNNTQVNYYPVTDDKSILSEFGENCQTTLVQEGCLYEVSYLDDFIDIFWSDSDYLEQVQDEQINSYIGNKDVFVSEYAATNPGEDIAESFTYFVVYEKPIGDDIVDQKINFFYDYIGLTELREQIRAGLEELK